MENNTINFGHNIIYKSVAIIAFAMLLFALPAKSATYYTISDVSNMTTVSTSQYYAKGQMLKMPDLAIENNYILDSITVKASSTGAYSNITYKWCPDDTTPSAGGTCGAPHYFDCDQIPVGVIYDLYTCYLPDNTEVDDEYLWIEIAPNTAYTYVSMKTPSTTYEDGQAWRWTGSTWETLNYDLQVFWTLIPGEANDFYIISPEDNVVFTYNPDDQIEINVKCYSPESSVAIYNEELYLSAYESDFVECDENSEATLYANLYPNTSYWTIIDEEYQSHPYEYYKRTLTYIAPVVGAYGDIMWNIKIEAPWITGSYGYFDLYENLNDSDLSSTYPFIFNIVSDGLALTYIASSSVNFVLEEIDTSFSVISEIRNADISTLSVYKDSIVEQVPVTSTAWTYYQAYLEYQDSIITDKIYFGAKSTTTVGVGTLKEEIESIVDKKEDEILELWGNWECKQYKPHNIFDVLNGVRYGLCWAFVPTPIQEKNLIGKYGDKVNTLKKKPPFGYYYAYKDALLPTSTASTTFSQYTTLPLLSTIRTYFGYILWILFGWYIWKRFRRFIIN